MHRLAHPMRKGVMTWKRRRRRKRRKRRKRKEKKKKKKKKKKRERIACSQSHTRAQWLLV
jgi:hypothetical protein